MTNMRQSIHSATDPSTRVSRASLAKSAGPEGRTSRYGLRVLAFALVAGLGLLAGGGFTPGATTLARPVSEPAANPPSSRPAQTCCTINLDSGWDQWASVPGFIPVNDLDNEWRVTFDPSLANAAPPERPAHVVTDTPWNTFPPSPNPSGGLTYPTSRWMSINAGRSPAPGPPTDYHYTYYFTLPAGFASPQLAMRLSADDHITQVTLNGQTLFSGSGGIFNQPPLVIPSNMPGAIPVIPSGFYLAGSNVNELTVTVTDMSGSLTGLIVGGEVTYEDCDRRAIKDIPDLTGITFWESTVAMAGDPPTPHWFPVSSTAVAGTSALTTQQTPLGPTPSNDFEGVAGVEFYDVFYSDWNGTFSLSGKFVTIEAVVTAAAPLGGGLNIARVDFNGTGKYADSVASFVALGNNAIPADVGKAIDGNPQTDTTMGNTSVPPAAPQRLRITVGFPCPCDPPPADLVAWWPLDEVAGATTVADIVGSNVGTPRFGPPSGTATSMAVACSTANGPASVVGGYVGNSMQSCNWGYVGVPNAPALNFAGASPFSIDAWIRTPLAGGPQTEPIVHKMGPSGNSGYFLYLAPPPGGGVANTLYLQIGPTVFPGPTITSVPGSWIFVAATRGNGLVNLYVGDGTNWSSVVSLPEPAALSASSSADLLIGGWDGNPHANLAIDEVEIFERALKEQELQEIAVARSSGKCRAEGRCDLTVDKKMDPSPPVAGQPVAFVVTVTNVGTAACPPTTTVLDNLPSGFIVTAWNPNTVAGWNCTQPAAISCTNPTLTLQPNASSLVFTVGGMIHSGVAMENCAEVQNPNDDNPTNNHDCVTFAPTPTPTPGCLPCHRVYLPIMYSHGYQGATDTPTPTDTAPATQRPTLVTTPTASEEPSPTEPPPTTAVPTAATDLPTSTPTFTDEPTVTPTATNRPTTAPPCAPQPPEMVAWWALDEPDGTTARDGIGDHHGTVQGGADVADPAKVGPGRVFDGMSGMIVVPSAPVLSPGAADFSIDAWVNPASDAMLPIVTMQNAPADVPLGYAFYLENRQLTFTMSNESSAMTGTAPAALPLDGEWHLVAVTIEQGSKTGGRLYTDGVLVHTFDTTALVGPVETRADLHIAHQPALGRGSPQRFFSGGIDELEIFHRALSAAEVLSLYTAGTFGKCNKPRPPQTLDDLFEAVARQAPEFGGMFLGPDEETLQVYLTDISPASVAAVQRAIEANFEASVIPPGGMVALQGQYDFRQLRGWYAHMMGPILSIPGVSLTDIDEAKNRLGIGVVSLDVEGRVIDQLTRLAIPREAVVIEETGPIEPLQDLRDPFSPRRGGYAITRLLQPSGVGIGTLGFNAVRQGVPGFVTNSHNTSTFWGLDGSTFYQSCGYYPAHVVGSETADPPGFVGLDLQSGFTCPTGFMCRFSDTAFVKYDSGIAWGKGVLERTIGLTIWDGSTGPHGCPPSTPPPGIVITVAAPPPITITSPPRKPYLHGLRLNKVGWRTGWTTGSIEGTCADYVANNQLRICQYMVGNQFDANPGNDNWRIATFGDSGSPVYRTNPPGAIRPELYGIVWGGSVFSNSFGAKKFVFSPIGGVYFQQTGIQSFKDLGQLHYCGSTSPC